MHVPVEVVKNYDHKEINLISHPLGKSKRISGGKITGEQGLELYYSTDSAAGSAGGPVIYNDGVVAMHIGKTEKTSDPGHPLKFGIKIMDILKDAGLPIDHFKE